MTQAEARILARAIADELMARLQPMTDELLTAIVGAEAHQ